MLRSTLIASFGCAVTVAQLVGGTAGTFEKIIPTPNEAGQNIYPDIPLWRHAVNIEGGVFVAGMNTAIGNVESWALDTTTFVWRKFGVAPEGVAFSAPDLFAFGGFILAVGGTSDNLATTLWYLPVSAGPNATWRTAIVRNQPDPHDGHRVVVFGGVLYMLGGLIQTGTPPTWSNAMWALDVAGWFASVPGTLTMSWVRLTQSGNSRWAARGAMSLDTYASSVVMFGGFTRNPSFVPTPGSNICSSPSAACSTFNDLWMWSPGLPNGPPVACPNNGDCGWSLVQPRSSAVPQGRFNHASGILADNLYIFGGESSTGVFLTDLWAFDFEARTWTQVQSTWIGGTTGFPPQLWPPSAVFNGHRFYIEATGDESGNAMYRWTPEALPPSPAGGDASPSGISAATAGAAAAAIFSAVNAAMLAFFIYRAARAPGGLAGGGSAGIHAASAGDAYAQLDTA